MSSRRLNDAIPSEWDKVAKKVFYHGKPVPYKPKKEASALDKQVGGDHYNKHSLQPTDYILANGLGFIEGNVVKYVTRHRDKGGKEDIKKAIHYLEMLLEKYEL